MSHVYLIASASAVKIGISASPDKRLKQLQTGSPYKLSFHLLIECHDEAAAQRLESILHKHFEPYRMSGEWFRLDAHAVTGYIQQCLSIASAVSGVTHYQTVIETKVYHEVDARNEIDRLQKLNRKFALDVEIFLHKLEGRALSTWILGCAGLMVYAAVKSVMMYL